MLVNIKINNVIGLILSNGLLMTGFFVFQWGYESIILASIIEPVLMAILAPLIVATLPIKSQLSKAERILSLFSLLIKSPMIFFFLFTQIVIFSLTITDINLEEMYKESGSFFGSFTLLIERFNLQPVFLMMSIAALLEWWNTVNMTASKADFKEHAKNVVNTPYVRMTISIFTVFMALIFTYSYNKNAPLEIFLPILIILKFSLELTLLKKEKIAY